MTPRQEKLFDELMARESEWMRHEQEACRKGDHQEAASCHAYRWECLRAAQRLLEA